MSVLAAMGLARAEDARQIAEMSRDLIEHGLAWSWTPARVQRSICGSDSTVVVARRDARIAAFAIMHLGDDAAHLNLLAVHPTCRRRGLASKLIEWLHATAVEAGVFRINLELRAHNVAGRAFYEKLGFREIGIAPGYYQGRETAQRMSKFLASGISGDGFQDSWTRR